MSEWRPYVRFRTPIMSTLTVDSERLIVEIQQRPAIWDTSREEYCNKMVKQELWHELCTIFFEKFDEFGKARQNEIGNELQKRWKSFRNSFSRELLRRKTLKPGKTYIYFDQLSFLLPNLKEKSVLDVDECNLVETGEGPVFEAHVSDGPTGEASNDSPECTSPPQKKKAKIPDIAEASNDSQECIPALQRKKAQNPDVFERMYDKLSESLQQRSVELDHQQDEDRMFLLSLITDLKSIPEYFKLSAKTEILQVLQKYKKHRKPPKSPSFRHQPQQTLSKMSDITPWNFGTLSEIQNSRRSVTEPFILQTFSVPPHQFHNSANEVECLVTPNLPGSQHTSSSVVSHSSDSLLDSG